MGVKPSEMNDEVWEYKATSNPNRTDEFKPILFGQFKTPSNPFLVPRMYVFIFAANL